MEKKYNKLKQYFNKGVSTTTGILIVVSVAILAGGLITWQMWPKQEAPTLPSIASPVSTTTPSPIPSLTPSPTSTPSIDETAKDLKDIATSLFDEHLDSYISSNTPLNSRLKSYIINNITIDIIEDNCFGFIVNFSVETFKEENNNWTDWVAGNGEIDGNWVKNKEMFVDVLTENNGYKIRESGTGRGSSSCMGI